MDEYSIPFIGGPRDGDVAHGASPPPLEIKCATARDATITLHSYDLVASPCDLDSPITSSLFYRHRGSTEIPVISPNL